MTTPEPTDAYRIRMRQHGLIVARAEGQHSLREIMHYATVYSQDGSLSIERRVNKRWRKYGVMEHV
jgi:hypothetical protein